MFGHTIMAGVGLPFLRGIETRGVHADPPDESIRAEQTANTVKMDEFARAY